MLLLQDVVFGLSEGLVSLVPALSLILLVWKSDSKELFEGLSRWVVTNDDELRPLIVFVVIDWAFDNSVILLTNTGGYFAGLDSSIFLKTICQNFLILFITEILCLQEAVSIIVSNKLCFCSTDGIMMLENTHGIKHRVLGFEHVLDFIILGFVVKNLLGKQFVGSMKIG